jgi:autotransporter-associated beta strand protein
MGPFFPYKGKNREPMKSALPPIYLATLLVFSPNALAATFVWDGGGTNNNWSTPENWLPDGSPLGASDTILTFDASARYSPSNNLGPFTLNRLNILNATTNAYNISGNQLQFVADGATQPRIFSNRNATSTISAPIDIAAGTNLNLEITTFHLNLDGVISGAGAIEKLNQAGGFNLNNANNSFSGGIIYRNLGGANGQWNLFRVTQSGAMGSGLVQLDGGNLNPHNSSTNANPGGLILNGVGLTFANDFLLLRDSPISVGQPNTAAHSNNSATLTGTINLNGNALTLRGQGTGTISGTISGAAGVRKIEGNTWNLSGTNTYTGPTSIFGGTLATNTLANGGTPSGIGASSNAAANLVINNSMLSYTGSTTSTDRRFTLSGNARFNVADPSATLTFESIQGSSFGGAGTTITKDGPGTLVFGRTGGTSTYLSSIGAFAILEGSLLNLPSAPVQINVNRLSSSGAALTLGNGANLGIFTPLEVLGANTDQLVRYTGTSQTATISASGLTFSGPGSGGFNTKTFDIDNGTADVDLRITSNITIYSGGSPNPPAVSRLIKTGAGTLDLTGNNLYRGGTSVVAGTLLVNNSTGSATGTGEVIVASGATLGGAGRITPGQVAPGTAGLMILSGGSLSPGNSPGVLSVDGDITLDGGSFLVVDLAFGGSSAPGNGTLGTDRILVTNGTVAIDGATLTGTWQGETQNIYQGGALTPDQLLWLITGADDITGTGFANAGASPGFAALFGDPTATPFLTSVDGQAFALFYDANFALGTLSGGNDLLLIAIPEPSRALLLAIAVACLPTRRRRRSV